MENNNLHPIWDYEKILALDQKRLRESDNETPEQRMRGLASETAGLSYLQDSEEERKAKAKAKAFTDKQSQKPKLTLEQQARINANLRKAAYCAKQPKPQRTPEKGLGYNLMPYNKAAKLFYLQLLKAFKPTPKTPQFVVNHHNKEIISNSLKWFIRDKSCKYDLDRGLAFLGNVGAGKSFLLDQLVKFANTHNLPTACRFAHFGKICTESNLKDKSKGTVFQPYKTGAWAFDEMKTDVVINDMGNKFRPFDLIIESLYPRWDKHRKCTHLAGNIQPSDLTDARVFDRFKQMFSLVLFKGESFR